MRFFLIFACLSFTACQNSEKNNQPLNPEATVRQWQTFMDKNDFKNARELSSVNTKKWLESIEAAFSSDTLIMNTDFEEIRCEEYSNKAMCICKVRQDIAEESHEDVFLLIKENGRWMVDLDNTDDLNNEFLEVGKQDSLSKKLK